MVTGGDYDPGVTRTEPPSSSTGPDAPRPRGITGLLLAVLALLSAVAPLATDMYLPSLPTVARDLGAAPGTTQLTVGAFMAGMMAGQLVFGPLSDRFGRRPLLLVGTVAATLASAGCALAPSVGVLLVLRVVQGLSGAAAVVLARAVVVDRSRGVEAARVFSLLMTITSVAPVAAPLIGALLADTVGWRGVFAILTALSLLMVVGTLAVVPETLPPAARSAGPGDFYRGLAALGRDRAFVGYVLTLCLSFGAMFGYISASSFVYQDELGFSPARFSAFFAAGAVGVSAVSVVNRRLVRRLPARGLLIGGVVNLCAASTALLLGVGLAGVRAAVVVPVLLWAVAGMGLILPNATALALTRAPRSAGTASAVLGACQFGTAALASSVLGALGAHAQALAVVMACCAALAAGALGIMTRGARPAR